MIVYKKLNSKYIIKIWYIINSKHMNTNIYIKYTIDKIKSKQVNLNSLITMLSYYAQEVDRKFDDILMENNIDKSDVVYMQTACSCTTNPQIPVEEYEQLMNSIYKSLALKTHPDKDNCDNKIDTTYTTYTTYTNDFIVIKDAYDNHDILTLIEFAGKYNLDEYIIENINVNLITVILEKKMFLIKNEIKNIKNSIGYQLLVVGNINSHIETLKQTIKIKKETEKWQKEKEEMEKKIKLLSV